MPMRSPCLRHKPLAAPTSRCALPTVQLAGGKVQCTTTLPQVVPADFNAVCPEAMREVTQLLIAPETLVSGNYVAICSAAKVCLERSFRSCASFWDFGAGRVT